MCTPHLNNHEWRRRKCITFGNRIRVPSVWLFFGLAGLALSCRTSWKTREPAAWLLSEVEPLAQRRLPVSAVTTSLTEVFKKSSAVVYFLHQRKCAGSTVRKELLSVYASVSGTEIAKAHSYIPCATTGCVNYDPDVRRTFFGDIRLFAGHISYHIPAARKFYGEEQVLITNMKHPVDRIASCLKYRHYEDTVSIFGADTVNHTDATALLFKEDKFGDSCLGESFRILSPYNPNKVVEVHQVQSVCNFICSEFHVLFVGNHQSNHTINALQGETLIERQLYSALSQKQVRVNTQNFSTQVERHLASLVKFCMIWKNLSLKERQSKHPPGHSLTSLFASAASTRA